MSRIPILLLALTTVVAPAQYGSSRDQATQQSAQTTTGRPIPNRTVPKPPNASSGSSDQPTIKVNVKLVNVYTTVVDQHGAPIGNLKKEDFNLTEDGNA